MDTKARIAVIGAGWWATYTHMPTIVKNTDAKLVALVDIRPEVLAKAAELYGVEQTYSDYREMLDQEKLDGAIIATWHTAHYKPALDCLNQDLHIVLEKPMVLDAVEARTLVETAQARKREIVMSYPFHYVPQTVRAREVVQGGELGEVVYISNMYSDIVHSLYRGDDMADREDVAEQYVVEGPGDVYSDPERSGGGQGHLQATHSVALMLFITGLRTERVLALMDNRETLVDVSDAIAARMRGGVLANIGSTGEVYGGKGTLFLQIYCTRGRIDLDYMSGTGTIYYADGRVEELAVPQNGEWDHLNYSGYPGFAPANNLVEVILEGANSHTPSYIGWHTVELLDAAYRSAASGGAAIDTASLYQT